MLNARIASGQACRNCTAARGAGRWIAIRYNHCCCARGGAL